MARTSMKKTTAATADTVENKTQSTKSQVKAVEKKMRFAKEDLIDCRSITNGILLYEGNRSGRLYRWADFNDIEQVEYQDLVYMITSRKPIINLPRIIIENDDIIDEYPQLKDLYDSIFSKGDFIEILNLPTIQMEKAINSLPKGAKESIRNLVSNMVASGEIDSVQKIKVLDSIFDTQLLLAMAEK